MKSNRFEKESTVWHDVSHLLTRKLTLGVTYAEAVTVTGENAHKRRHRLMTFSVSVQCSWGYQTVISYVYGLNCVYSE